MQIRDRVVIVTGASSGIGRETARQFVASAAHAVLASRNREKLEALAEELAPLPGRTLVVPTDVTDRLAVEALTRRTVEEFGAIDVLVNNAGFGVFAPIAGGNQENMRRMFEVNFWGAINCIQAVVPYMQAQRRGHIVNVASIAARVATPYLGVYSATKFALRAVSDALRIELAGSGIHVSTIYPGLTQTSFTENMVQEVPAPRFPPVVRFVSPSLVARRIVQAVRWNLRDVYVSPEDVGAVLANAFAPFAVDWVFRAFLGAQEASRPGLELGEEKEGERFAPDPEPN
jgi:short-subunit dehydrogenase